MIPPTLNGVCRCVCCKLLLIGGVCVQHLRAAANMNRDKMTREVVIKNLRLMRAGTELLKFGARGQPKFRQFQLTNDNQGNRYVAWSSENKRPDQTRSKFTDEHVVGCVGITLSLIHI